MTEFEIDERARQRVVEFLSFRADAAATAEIEPQRSCQMFEAEMPGSIAQRTAVDLMQFLQQQGS